MKGRKFMQVSNLDGKVAIVTGASHPMGIGRAIALELGQRGASVVVTDLPEFVSDLDKVVIELSDFGAKALGNVVDITKLDHIEECVSRTLDTFGHIDCLVNNAGVSAGSPIFTDNSVRDWDLAYEVNLKGTAMFCRTVLPIMEKKTSGVIVNIASLAGLGAIPGMPVPYTASKFAVVGMTKAIAIEFGACNIRAIAVCPGSVHTQMYEHAMESISKAYDISLEEASKLENSTIPMERPANAGEVASVVAHLVSDDASYVTGVALPIAGGMPTGL
jgi:3-oxoacyl-[acyl-carrier protein] reductase